MTRIALAGSGPILLPPVDAPARPAPTRALTSVLAASAQRDDLPETRFDDVRCGAAVLVTATSMLGADALRTLSRRVLQDIDDEIEAVDAASRSLTGAGPFDPEAVFSFMVLLSRSLAVGPEHQLRDDLQRLGWQRTGPVMPAAFMPRELHHGELALKDDARSGRVRCFARTHAGQYLAFDGETFSLSQTRPDHATALTGGDYLVNRGLNLDRTMLGRIRLPTSFEAPVALRRSREQGWTDLSRARFHLAMHQLTGQVSQLVEELRGDLINQRTRAATVTEELSTDRVPRRQTIQQLQDLLWFRHAHQRGGYDAAELQAAARTAGLERFDLPGAGSSVRHIVAKLAPGEVAVLLEDHHYTMYGRAPDGRHYVFDSLAGLTGARCFEFVDPKRLSRSRAPHPFSGRTVVSCYRPSAADQP